MYTYNQLLIHSSNLTLMASLLEEYFSNQNLSRDISIEIRINNAEERMLVLFPTTINIEYIVFFFVFLGTEDEFRDADKKAWFNAPNELNEQSSGSDFGIDIDGRNTFSRVMLTNNVTEDFVIGYSSENKKIEFYYTGDFKSSEATGFEKEDFFHHDFQKIKVMNFKVEETKDSASPTSIVLIAGLIVVVVLLFLFFNFID